jgi:exonuclease III
MSSKRPRSDSSPSSTVPAEDAITFACFNVNGIKSKLVSTGKNMKPLWLSEWLKRTAVTADFLLLQEIRCGDVFVIRGLLSDASFPRQISLEIGSGGHAGVGIFAPQQSATTPTVVHARSGLPRYKHLGLDDPGRLNTMWIGAPYNIIVLNVYAPNSGLDERTKKPTNEVKRQMWDDCFREYVTLLLNDGIIVEKAEGGGGGGAGSTSASGGAAGGGSGDSSSLLPDYTLFIGRMLILGDMNVIPKIAETVPETADIYIAPTSSSRLYAGMHDFERRNFKRLLDTTLLTDVWRHHNPLASREGFTYADDRCQGRFDYALASPSILPLLGPLTIDRDRETKDHYPFTITLRATPPLPIVLLASSMAVVAAAPDDGDGDGDDADTNYDDADTVVEEVVVK